MNDNDIIKALKHCVNGGDCADCMYNEGHCLGLTANALNLINRQKTEIERLQEYYKLYFEREMVIEELNTQIEHLSGNLKFVRGTAERQLAEIERLTDYNENLLTANTALSNEILDIRAEAVKEFAESVKKNRRAILYAIYDRTEYSNIVDNLVKEMTEGEDETC